jgi:hypothetical protein
MRNVGLINSISSRFRCPFRVKLGPRTATELGPFIPSQRTCGDGTAMTVSCHQRTPPQLKACVIQSRHRRDRAQFLAQRDTKQLASSRQPAQSIIGIAASSLRLSMRTEQMKPLLREIRQLRQLTYDPKCEMAHRQEPVWLCKVDGGPSVGSAPRGLKSGCAMKVN